LRQSQRAWDEYDAYLWDIDGTLLTCTDLVHYNAFNTAMSAAVGTPVTIDYVKTHGNVDVGIMRDAFALHDVAEQIWQPKREEIIRRMGEEVQAHREALVFTVHPHVRETLMHLKRRGALLATATGNLAAIGTVKLQEAGLYPFFDLFGWSDACLSRAEVFSAIAHDVRQVRGEQAALCVVGDTVADVDAACACGLDVLAVATGIYAVEELRERGASFAVNTLEALVRDT
jgi:phosphoglycolate phosphatase